MEIPIHTPFIKLDAFLKLSGAAVTGGMAKEMIADSQVAVNGEICLQRGRKLTPGDRVDCGGRVYTVTGQADES